MYYVHENCDIILFSSTLTLAQVSAAKKYHLFMLFLLFSICESLHGPIMFNVAVNG